MSVGWRDLHSSCMEPAWNPHGTRAGSAPRACLHGACRATAAGHGVLTTGNVTPCLDGCSCQQQGQHSAGLGRWRGGRPALRLERGGAPRPRLPLPLPRQLPCLLPRQLAWTAVLLRTVRQQPPPPPPSTRPHCPSARRRRRQARFMRPLQDDDGDTDGGTVDTTLSGFAELAEVDEGGEEPVSSPGPAAADGTQAAASRPPHPPAAAAATAPVRPGGHARRWAGGKGGGAAAWRRAH